jgi:hypothetical protein
MRNVTQMRDKCNKFASYVHLQWATICRLEHALRERNMTNSYLIKCSPVFQQLFTQINQPIHTTFFLAAQRVAR